MASRTARHRFDPVSFVLGATAIVAGLIVLAGGSLLDDAAVLVPAGLIALGIAVLLRVGPRRDGLDGAGVPAVAPQPGNAGPTFSGAELYDLLVPDPTQEFLAELEERRRSDAAADGTNGGSEPDEAPPDDHTDEAGPPEDEAPPDDRTDEAGPPDGAGSPDDVDRLDDEGPPDDDTARDAQPWPPSPDPG